jgi:hypothetical protein
MTMLFLLILAQIAGPVAGTSCDPLHGGPADGMCKGSVVIDGGSFKVVALQPATGTGATIAPEVAKMLSAMLRKQRTGSNFDARSLAAGATEEFCQTFSSDCLSSKPLRSWPLGKEFVPNRPYGLADGRIRIEWMHNGKLEFLSFVTFDGAKIKDVSTAPAQMPVRGS